MCQTVTQENEEGNNTTGAQCILNGQIQKEPARDTFKSGFQDHVDKVACFANFKLKVYITVQKSRRFMHQTKFLLHTGTSINFRKEAKFKAQ